MSRLRQAAFHIQSTILRSVLTTDRADEISVCLQDVYEHQRNCGRSAPHALLSCAVQLTSLGVADWWLQFASRPQAALPQPGIIHNLDRALPYGRPAASGALLAMAALYFVNWRVVEEYNEKLFDSPFGMMVLLFCITAYAFARICRTAFMRGEYEPLGLLYVAGFGVFVGAISGSSILFGSDMMGYRLPDYLYAPLLILPPIAASILNVYAKYLSPDCATAE